MAKILPIIIHPDKNLRKKSEPIDEKTIETKEAKELVADMKLTMEKKDGIGLAAPQIGKNIRLVVINTKDGILAMFNPIIQKKSLFKVWDQEGCLSVPDTFGDVKRHKRVICFYTDEKGRKVKLKAQGLLARVIQHETDHLDGILFIDKAKNIIEIKDNKKM